jgi:hypothetical protein
LAGQTKSPPNLQYPYITRLWRRIGIKKPSLSIFVTFHRALIGLKILRKILSPRIIFSIKKERVKIIYWGSLPFVQVGIMRNLK